jgi:hypothetical protein
MLGLLTSGSGDEARCKLKKRKSAVRADLVGDELMARVTPLPHPVFFGKEFGFA